MQPDEPAGSDLMPDLVPDVAREESSVDPSRELVVRVVPAEIVAPESRAALVRARLSALAQQPAVAAAAAFGAGVVLGLVRGTVVRGGTLAPVAARAGSTAGPVVQHVVHHVIHHVVHHVSPAPDPLTSVAMVVVRRTEGAGG